MNQHFRHHGPGCNCGRFSLFNKQNSTDNIRQGSCKCWLMWFTFIADSKSLANTLHWSSFFSGAERFLVMSAVFVVSWNYWGQNWFNAIDMIFTMFLLLHWTPSEVSGLLFRSDLHGTLSNIIRGEMSYSSQIPRKLNICMTFEVTFRIIFVSCVALDRLILQAQTSTKLLTFGSRFVQRTLKRCAQTCSSLHGVGGKQWQMQQLHCIVHF